jgi:uncharacterized OB-fold protein
MTGWLDDVEALTLKGQIAVPYTWWVGETGSRFLIGLRDDEKILGNRCSTCNTVYVPPRKNCGRCFEEITDWVELSPEGVVKAHTVVRYPSPVQPAEPPFAYALIRLDGADVDLLHIVRNDLDRLKNGVRVRARFKEERTGHILDIEDFEILA